MVGTKTTTVKITAITLLKVLFGSEIYVAYCVHLEQIKCIVKLRQTFQINIKLLILYTPKILQSRKGSLCTLDLINGNSGETAKHR